MLVVVLLSFILSPVILMRSHGAAHWIEAVGVVAHGHGHAEGGVHGGHDVTDHDHQFQALALADANALPRPPAVLVRLSDSRLAGLVRDGPRRPPRQI